MTLSFRRATDCGSNLFATRASWSGCRFATTRICSAFPGETDDKRRADKSDQQVLIDSRGFHIETDE